LTAELFHRTITPDVLLAARAVGAFRRFSKGNCSRRDTSMPMKKKAKKKKKH